VLQEGEEMNIDLEEAHTQLNDIEKLIEEGKFKKARGIIIKFISVLENMDHRLKTMRDEK
jgi:hypothetical protein